MGVETATVVAKKTQLTPADYVHLHNHTHHSLLDGLTKIPDLVNAVKDMGMEAVAVTDHGTMSGAVDFYKSAKDAGVKPIIGMEAYVAARSRHDRDPAKERGAKKFVKLTHMDAIRRNLKVMDMTALTMCRENGLPIVVFNLNVPGNITRAALGAPIGTMVTGG